MDADTDDATFNSTMSDALFQTGLLWDTEFGKLVNLWTKNGTIPDFESRPENELERDGIVWAQRLSLSIATNLYKVGEIHLCPTFCYNRLFNTV
jgi:hypothetical protein